MGQEDGGVDELGDLLHLDMPAPSAVGVRRPLAHIRRLLIPPITLRVAHEVPRLQVAKDARSVPGPLVVGIEHVPLVVPADPAG